MEMLVVAGGKPSPMSNWSQINAEGAARRAQAKAAQIPRALDVETGRPIPLHPPSKLPQPGIFRRIQLASMNKFFTMVLPWLSKRLLSAVAAVGVMIGAPPEANQQVTAFITAGLVFGAECLQKWLRLKWSKGKSAEALRAVKEGLRPEG